MSVTSTGATSITATAAPGSTATPAASHPARRWVLWISVVLVLMLIVTFIAGRSGASGAALDPNNPGPDGMQALAQVLGDQGVGVQVVRGVSNLPDGSANGATVMVSTTNLLSKDSGEDLLNYVNDASSFVILSPADNLHEVFDIDVDVNVLNTPTAMSPECENTLWDARDQVTNGDTLLEVDSTIGPDEVTICLPPSPGYNTGGARSGYLVEVDREGIDQDGIDPNRAASTTLAGVGSSLTNANILDQANAATGLRLLGSSDRLIWVIPSIRDAGELSPTGLFDVLPAPMLPSIVLLLLALGVWALVRGRRLGPVTTEPLPVIIHAIETTTSRGRLYREARDRPRAMASLQLATRQRLASRLGLALGANPEQVVTAVAAATGRHTGEINRLLVDTNVDDDDTFVQIARDLRSLEEGIPST